MEGHIREIMYEVKACCSLSLYIYNIIYIYMLYGPHLYQYNKGKEQRSEGEWRRSAASKERHRLCCCACRAGWETVTMMK